MYCNHTKNFWKFFLKHPSKIISLFITTLLTVPEGNPCGRGEGNSLDNWIGMLDKGLNDP